MVSRLLHRFALVGCVVMLSGGWCVAAEPQHYFVASNGDDAWSGLLATPNAAKTDGPWATLTHARDQIRQQKAAAPAGLVVQIRSGMYCLEQTFQLTPDDSGTATAPIVYEAYPGETPVLVGGRLVGGFQPHEGQIFKADLKGQGLADARFRQLFWNGQRQHLARYPNFDPQDPYAGGWAYADGQEVSMHATIAGEDKHSLTIKPADRRAWGQIEEAELFVFPRYNWWNDILPLRTFDANSGQVTTRGDASYFIRPGDRYYLQNLREELDAPGEWYLDRQAQILYFWPPGEIAHAQVYIPTLETIVEFQGVSHVTLRGLTLECCEGTAVQIRDSSQCQIAGCTIRNVGGRCSSGDAAVQVRGGDHVGVVGCDIYEVGSHGIQLSGGDRKTLTPAGHYADNNYLHHTGVFYKQGVGVALNGVGNRASHNLIHDCPRFGLLYGGNDQLLEFNHVRHVNLETADTGVAYSGGRDWLSPRGTVIRYNYFHDSFGFGKEKEGSPWITPHYAWGIYLDDNSAEVTIYGNIVVRALRGLVHFHCARDTTVENNIFIDGMLQQIEMNGWADYSDFLDQMSPAYEEYVHLPAWQKYAGLQSGGPPKDAVPMAGNRIRRNIFYYREPSAQLYTYRRLRLDHFECDENLVYHFGEPVRVSLGKKPEDWTQWQQRGMDQHSLVADPLFVDAEQDDYRLRPESPAFRLGFEPIPVEKIGPYASADRASWPIVEAPGAREAGYERATLAHRPKP